MPKPINLIIGGSLVAFIVFLLFSLDTNSIKNVLNQYKLLPQPEKFTELYIEDHLKLPNTIEPNEEYSFRFTTHNLEYQLMNYEYAINAISSDSAKLIKKGSFPLNHHESKTVEGNFTSEDIEGRTKIEIKLNNINQSIHFWVEEATQEAELLE